MKNLSWEAVLQDFWGDYSHQLELSYPGLHLHNLKRFVFDLYGMGYLSFDEFIHSFCTQTTWKKDLLEGKPLGHIEHKSYFYKSSFFVNSKVLIPRSETEILVERAVTLVNKHPKWTCVAEVGVGSGALILSLAMDVDRALDITAIDLSAEALAVARINSFRSTYNHHAKTVIHFKQADRLNGVTQKFDLVVSNPPYLRRGQDEVHSQVDHFEPHLALYLDACDYNNWFGHFFQQVFDCLTTGGIFLMEGNPDTLSELETMARNTGFIEVRIIMDYHQRKRILEAKRG